MNPNVAARSRKPSALVIDDDDLVRETIASILETVGYDVVQADDGVIGLRRFDEHPVDLVVTDILMPYKEGIETIVELRRRTLEIKIIAVTGGGHIGAAPILEAARQLGADEVLRKPFSRNDLLKLIT